MIKHRIFIDDWREPSSKHENSSDWILCESYDDFNKKINELIEKKEWISEISFDYILAPNPQGYDGSSCFKLLARTIQKNKLPIPEKIYIHSEYPNAEEHFKSTAMSLSYHNDTDVDLIKIHENGTQTILKTWQQ